MAKQSNRANAKKSDSFGNGKVTPIQVAYIVDRYLLENSFSDTLSAFRIEASSLLANSALNQAPNGLLSLGAILNEYISLKEQKVIVDHEKIRLDQEKGRVQNLLQGMQSAMSAYNASGSSSAPLVSSVTTQQPAIKLPQTNSIALDRDSRVQLIKGSTSGPPLYKTPVHHVSTPSNINTQVANFTSPVMSNPPALNKRKDAKIISVPPPLAKRPRGKSSTKMISQQGNGSSSQEIAQPSCVVTSSGNECMIGNGSSVQQGSSVAKCLFNQPSVSVPTNTSVPMTPPRATSSQSEKSVSPLEITSPTNCSTDNTPEGFTTRCTVISSKRVTVSPFKQITYSMERNQCISTSSPVKANLKRQTKRDHVKGRLDFDGSDAAMNLDKPMDYEIPTSESEKENDLFDIELSLDAIGGDFSFSDMLRDFDLECEEMGYSCQQTIGASPDDASGSSPESVDGNQLVSEFSSTVTELLSQKDMNMPGIDSLTSVQSVTRCIKIISPVKTQGRSLDQNCSPTN